MEENEYIFGCDTTIKGTALLHAVAKQNVNEVKKLIAAGVNINAVGFYQESDSSGGPDSHYGESWEPACMLQIELASPLLLAVYKRDIGITKALLSAGADVNAKDGDGMTPLMYAIQDHDINLINALIAAGADVNAAGLMAERL